jgi:hypothetical protein
MLVASFVGTTGITGVGLTFATAGTLGLGFGATVIVGAFIGMGVLVGALHVAHPKIPLEPFVHCELQFGKQLCPGAIVGFGVAVGFTDRPAASEGVGVGLQSVPIHPNQQKEGISVGNMEDASGDPIGIHCPVFLS